MNPEKEILVVRLKVLVKPEMEAEIRNAIKKQMDSGLLLLPSWCEAEVISGDAEIKFEGETLKEVTDE